MLISERVEESQMGDNLAVLLAIGVLGDSERLFVTNYLRSGVEGISFSASFCAAIRSIKFLFSS